jgi:3-hydroxyacyl-CoA dehydrogenase
MKSIVEDAQAKSACYRDIEAVVGADLLWSSTSNFPMDPTRRGHGSLRTSHCRPSPERAIVVHPVQTQLIIFVEVVPGEQTSDETVTTTMRFCGDVDLRAVDVPR